MVGGRPVKAITRERLIGASEGARIVLLEAPGGYGKTTLSEQLVVAWELGPIRVRFRDRTPLASAVAELIRGVRRAGFADIAHAMQSSATDGPLACLDEFVGCITQHGISAVVVLDDVQRLDAEAAAAFAQALADLPAGCRAVVAGRDLAEFVHVVPARQVVSIGTEQLRMTESEIALVLGTDAPGPLAAEIAAATTGWCAAVGLAVQRVEADPTWSPTAGNAARVLLQEIVDDIVAHEPHLARLAALPLVDSEVSTIVGGPDLLRRGLAAGVLAPRVGGWYVVPDPIREALDQPTIAEAEIRAQVACHYHGRGELRAAIEVLAGDLSDSGALAAFLATVPWTELELLDANEFSDVIDALTDSALLLHPELLVVASQAVELTAPQRRSAWLARAIELAGARGDDTVVRAAQAEQTRDLASSALLDEAVALATSVLETATEAEAVTRAKALTSIARVEAFYCTATSLATAARLYAEAARLFHAVNESRWRAEALARRGYTALFMAGFPVDGESEMRAALALLPVGDHTRAFWLTNYSDVLDYLGRSAEARAAAREAMEIGVRRHDRAVVSMAWWSMSWIAAHCGDRAAFADAVNEFERNCGPWVRPGQMVEFLASTAEHAAVLGDHDRYASFVERARASAEPLDYLAPVELAEFANCAIVGEPHDALLRFDALDFGVAQVPSNRPTLLILRALATARAGDLERAAALRREALDCAAAMRVPDLVARYTPDVLATLDRLLADVAIVADTAEALTTLQLFGGFSLRVAGADCTPQPGHPSALVKMLALNGAMTPDAAIDALWPDADTETGRRRLRNLLNRIRQRAGEVVVRDGELLRLRPEVSSDLAVFERRTAAALSGPENERVGSARLALGLYTGDLLPGDVYDDWTVGPRERAKRQYLTLVDLVADDAVQRGDHDEAVRLLDQAISVEPLDEARYERLCAVLLALGRTGSAREVATRAISVLEEMGEIAGPELRRLATIGRSDAVSGVE